MKIYTQEHWNQQVQKLWPCLKGSLAKVYKPCIRPDCPACRRGDKHPNWLLAYTENGKRRCVYVPLDMVKIIQQALKNGRRVEKLLYQMGPRLVKSRMKPPSASKPKS